MAKIIRLSVPGKNRKTSRPPATGGKARIILFPGVRYEYLGEPADVTRETLPARRRGHGSWRP